LAYRTKPDSLFQKYREKNSLTPGARAPCTCPLYGDAILLGGQNLFWRFNANADDKRGTACSMLVVHACSVYTFQLYRSLRAKTTRNSLYTTRSVTYILNGWQVAMTDD